MREISRSGENLWISAEPRTWFDTTIERILSKSLTVESSNANSSVYAGYRYIKIYEPRAIYIALGATYIPARSATLIIESAVLKATDKIAPEMQLNQEIAELVLTEATTILTHRPALKSGTLRFDKMHIHPFDYTLKAWRYATRVLIGLLIITDYEALSDEEIIDKLHAFADQ